jgi:hypothetical protein
MKSVLCLTVCVLSLLVLASTAQGAEAEARGDFVFDVEGAAGTVIFDSAIDPRGAVQGKMSFTATVDIGDPEGSGKAVPTKIGFTAEFDCMLAHKNQAAMSGVITSSNVREYVGQQATMVVVDNGVDGDTFTWGVYQPMDPAVHKQLLTVQDYEYCPAVDPDSKDPPRCETDPGASLTWVASDYELCPYPTKENPNPPCEKDPGAYKAGLSTTPIVVDCESFPLASYSLNEIRRGGGDVVVKVDE